MIDTGQLKLYFLLLCIFGCTLPTHSSLRPGVQVLLSKSGPVSDGGTPRGRNFEELYRQFLRDNFTQTDIAMEDQFGNDQAAKYNLTQLYMTKLKYQNPASIRARSAGVLVNLRYLSAQVLGKWKYTRKSWTHVQDSGYIRINLTRGRARILKPSHTPPVPDEIRCSIRFHGVDVSFVSRSGFLFDRLGDLIQAQMNAVAEKVICDTLKRAMALSLQSRDETSAISRPPRTPKSRNSSASPSSMVLQTTYFFGPGQEIALNYSLLTPPALQNKFIVLKMKGEFQMSNGEATQAGSHFMHHPSFPNLDTVTSLPPAAIPSANSDKSLAIYFMSDSVINSLSNLLYQKRRLMAYLTHDMTPDICPMTDCIQKLFPHAVKDVDDSLKPLVEVMLSASEPPALLISRARGTELWLKASMSVYLRNQTGDGSSLYLGTLRTHARYVISIRIDANRIKCSARLQHASEFQLVHTAFTLTDSFSEVLDGNVQSTRTSAFEIGSKRLFENVNEKFLELKLDEICDFGLPLPLVKGETLELSSPDLIMYHGHYLVLTAERQKQ